MVLIKLSEENNASVGKKNTKNPLIQNSEEFAKLSEFSRGLLADK